MSELKLSARQLEVLKMVADRRGSDIRRMPVDFQQTVDQLDQLHALRRDGAGWRVTFVGAQLLAHGEPLED